MKIEKEKIVQLTYSLYVDGENGDEELMERAPENHPLVYCHGVGMMLPVFEAALAGKEAGEDFDFRIACQDAYGEYDDEGVLTLDKALFCDGDGEFDEERVQVGRVIPMNTQDGQVVNAQVVEVTDEHVTIDLNHPLAGENLHFVGKILTVREATAEELERIRNPHKCGGCGGGKCKSRKNDSNGCGGCGGCE
ncbi:MAG: FKBP-type peptidyl-prolyl cis-trans isomerase [Paludibacteraceae bacterium]|nr:FKBP-type peptidyl-prolyl cis-trans isomerase [Paludibacteraceae bacterium]MBR1480794.1 FKBP-type peptidyl-prolyl cis-trans isomerase [Paludibacteraceae bacterium]